MKSKESILFLVIGISVILLINFKQEATSSLLTSQQVENSEILNDNTDKATVSKRNLDKVSLNQSPEFTMTRPDGAIELDEFGNLVVNKNLKRLFDYYLSGTGRFSLEHLRDEMLKMASDGLNEDQQMQLVSAFNNYTNYLKELERFALQLDGKLSLQDKFSALSEFRKGHLGDEMAESFFAEEEQYTMYVLNDKNANHSSVTAAQELLWLQAEEESTAFHDALSDQAQWLEMNFSENEIYQIRKQQFGEAAAVRLAQLDDQRSQWQSILQDYIQQRELIANLQSSVSLEQLHSSYSPSEVKRLKAQWRIRSE